MSSVISNILNKIENGISKRTREETNFNNQYYFNATLNELSKTNLWWVDDAEIRNDSIQISGWAVAPQGKHDDVTFAVNNIQFNEIQYPICNSAFAKLYYFIPNSAMCGFKSIMHIKESELLSINNVLTFSIVNKKTLIPIDGYHNVHFQNINNDNLPIPDDNNLTRVGAQGVKHYRNVGFDKFIRIENALKKYTNKTYGDMERILDWGCGCGQVIRYFNKYSNVEINGADIDMVNIKWCERNLNFAKFHHVPLNPPTKFDNNYFDLIFGISVLTHLRENDQSDWLSELSRISKKDSIVLISVHGNGGVAFRNELFNIDELLKWQEKGFVALGVDKAIDSIGDKEYYTTSFQTDWYIKKYWSEYFKIIDIIPSYIGHFQDLVVMQKI
jgi:SAM-dependent methyltransferase